MPTLSKRTVIESLTTAIADTFGADYGHTEVAIGMMPDAFLIVQVGVSESARAAGGPAMEWLHSRFRRLRSVTSTAAPRAGVIQCEMHQRDAVRFRDTINHLAAKVTTADSANAMNLEVAEIHMMRFTRRFLERG